MPTESLQSTTGIPQQSFQNVSLSVREQETSYASNASPIEGENAERNQELSPPAPSTMFSSRNNFSPETKKEKGHQAQSTSKGQNTYKHINPEATKEKRNQVEMASKEKDVYNHINPEATKQTGKPPNIPPTNGV